MVRANYAEEKRASMLMDAPVPCESLSSVLGGLAANPAPTGGLLGSAIIAALPSLFASLPQEST